MKVIIPADRTSVAEPATLSMGNVMGNPKTSHLYPNATHCPIPYSVPPAKSSKKKVIAAT
eukprot:6819924-Ditylum_brightwellii.AAC.1